MPEKILPSETINKAAEAMLGLPTNRVVAEARKILQCRLEEVTAAVARNSERQDEAKNRNNLDDLSNIARDFRAHRDDVEQFRHARNRLAAAIKNAAPMIDKWEREATEGLESTTALAMTITKKDGKTQGKPLKRDDPAYVAIRRAIHDFVQNLNFTREYMADLTQEARSRPDHISSRLRNLPKHMREIDESLAVIESQAKSKSFY